MSDKKQLTHMSQFSIIREPGEQKLHDKSIPKKQPPQHQKTSELKFKIEPIGIQPEDDDDLETCPSRTRSSWPHQIIPWWKPADRFEKPPYSYATLIAHAILASKDGRLTLSDIYKWISEAYPYYKRGQKGWQNSIRHNLSLNKKWFVKFDRRPTQAHPGKGGYWTLQVNMEKIFVDNLSQAGGHSRRHHDIGMYSSLSNQYYRSPSDDCDESFEEDAHLNAMCPNILITVPADYEAKKTKTPAQAVVSAPRIRNMTSQEKKNMSTPSHVVTPKTDPKNFIIRFNPSSDLKRRKTADSPPRPAPKPGKKRNPVEPGSSTAEDDREDSGVELDMDEHLSKKRKSATVDTTASSITASPDFPNMNMVDQTMVRPEDVIGTMNFNQDYMFGEPEPPMLLTQEYTHFYDAETQNLLNGLQSCTYPVLEEQQEQQHPDMKTIDLQFNAFDKTIHYPDLFDIEQFSDINHQMFMPELSTYNMEQYIDMSIMEDTKPSDLLLEDESTTLNSFWNDSGSCYMNFDLNNTMPFVVQDN
ncbi:hypothetical protein INT47_007803 [Mucor saturninus]|uniref:Fork-head domain-containing protein n=1 Tax=Mucor saturninus TaxID=64648 RepID=A0A8H7VBV3_9FUNG|nr:hypothetical protein INT47_007803 [Mucor saturninus]